MATVKSKGPLVDPGLCRCCRSIKRCRILTSEYNWMGKTEIYSDLIMDCFGLLLTHLDDEEKELCICATCVSRLRDAYAFKSQVLQSEEIFLQTKLGNRTESSADVKVVVEVKTEALPSEEEGEYLNDDCFEDDMPLTQFVTVKAEKSLPEKPAKKLKTKGSDAGDVRPKKSTQMLKKIEKMHTKLNKKLEKTSTSAKTKTPKSKPTKKEPVIDNDHMVYANTVTLVKSSYICPFHNRVSNYYCFYCKEQFTDPTELREHTSKHDPETFENMIENKKIPKIDITRIDCRLCDVKIDNLDTLKSHVTDCHKKFLHPAKNEFLKFRLTLNSLTCTECDQSFPYFDSLKKHMNEHFGTHVCDMCGACFLEQSSLATHIRSHNKIESNFPCEVCGKNLKSKYSRYLHVATVHEKKPIVNCYKCDASFLSYALRTRHLIEAHGDKRTFPCKLCDKVYNRRKTLMEHNRRNHLKVYRHQCNLCDQKFYLPSRLKEHMATHTGERNFRCDLCEKSYPRLQSLQEHMRTHTNDRKYKCNICDTSFTQSASFNSHMKTHQQNFGMDASFR